MFFYKLSRTVNYVIVKFWNCCICRPPLYQSANQPRCKNNLEKVYDSYNTDYENVLCNQILMPHQNSAYSTHNEDLHRHMYAPLLVQNDTNKLAPTRDCTTLTLEDPNMFVLSNKGEENTLPLQYSDCKLYKSVDISSDNVKEVYRSNEKEQAKMWPQDK